MSLLVPLYYLLIVGLLSFAYGIHKTKPFFVYIGCSCILLVYLIFIPFNIWNYRHNNNKINRHNLYSELYWRGYEKGMNDTYKKFEPEPPPPESLTDPLWEGLFDIKNGFVQAPIIYYKICMERGNKCPFCGTENLCIDIHKTCPNCDRPWPPSKEYFREHFNKKEYLAIYDGALSR